MIFKTAPADFNSKYHIVNCYVEYEGKILLLQRQRNKPQPGTWGVPAGKLNEPEKPQEAIIRELREETGIEAGAKQISFGSKVFVRYPDYDFVYHIFHLRLNEEPAVTLNPEEHKAYQWLSPQKALRIELIQDEGNCIKLFYNL